jgi:hypothetical protein
MSFQQWCYCLGGGPCFLCQLRSWPAIGNSATGTRPLLSSKIATAFPSARCRALSTSTYLSTAAAAARAVLSSLAARARQIRFRSVASAGALRQRTLGGLHR